MAEEKPKEEETSTIKILRKEIDDLKQKVYVEYEKRLKKLEEEIW